MFLFGSEPRTDVNLPFWPLEKVDNFLHVFYGEFENIVFFHLDDIIGKG